MGVAEVVGFAVCWLVVAGLMLWGVFTEKKRGPSRFEPPAGAAAWHPTRPACTSPSDWVVVEVAEGCTPQVAEQARFLAAAWLASRESTWPRCHPPTYELRPPPREMAPVPPGC